MALRARSAAPSACRWAQPAIFLRAWPRLVNGVSLSSSSRIRRFNALDKGILGELARSDVVPLDPGSPHHPSTMFEVGSVPLSRTIMPGVPRMAINSLSSLTTCVPEIEASGTAATHSRVTSSTILSTRNLRPIGIRSCTKSRLQRQMRCAGTRAGARAPIASLRPLRRHAVKLSSPYTSWVFLQLILSPSRRSRIATSIAKLTALLRQIAQLFSKHTIIIATRLVKDYALVRRSDAERPPLADIKQILQTHIGRYGIRQQSLEFRVLALKLPLPSGLRHLF